MVLPACNIYGAEQQVVDWQTLRQTPKACGAVRMSSSGDRAPWLVLGVNVELKDISNPRYRNAWFSAVVLELGMDIRQAKVQYNHFHETNGSPLVETLNLATPSKDVNSSVTDSAKGPFGVACTNASVVGADCDGKEMVAIRPKPPATASEYWGPAKWRVGEWVEVFTLSCWWEGVVSKLPSSKERSAAPIHVVYPDYLGYGVTRTAVTIRDKPDIIPSSDA